MSKPRNVSPDGLEHLKQVEGFRPHTYDDFSPNRPFEKGDTPRGTLTIGYGHTGVMASPGNVITEADGTDLLAVDLTEAESTVYRLVKVDLDRGQYDALCSFVFNIGSENFRRSTLLRKLNAGDRDGAAMEFQRWVYSKGKRLPGLVIRRRAEAEMFNGTARLSFGRLEVEALAKEGEELLGIGSAIRPDAVEERGVMKSPVKSKTILASVFGLTGAAVSGIASALEALDLAGIFREMPPMVQLATSLWIGACCIFLILNRLREYQEGEH